MAALSIALRLLATLVVVTVAGYVGWRLWYYYTLAPWTRDARVLANVVELAPDVSGLISAINVVLLTALSTLGAAIYNLISDLVGGIEVTLTDP